MNNSTACATFMISLYSSLYFNCYFHLDTAPIPPAKHFPKISDVKIESRSFYKEIVQDIKILLMTATEIELRGIMGYLKPKDGKEKIIETFVNGEKVYIGKYGQCPVVVGMSAPAKAQQGPLDACLVTTKIMIAIELHCVIAVGICYGMDESKTSSGDVIVSDIICDCTCLRVEKDSSLTRRGGEPSVGHTLKQIFRTPNDYSHTYQDGKEVKVHCGPIISRPDLVNNSEYKEKLKCLRPNVLGGEMEGAGIMAAIEKVYNNRAQAIVIKAICDWGDGEKSKAADWKPFSSHAAARYVHHQMNKPANAECLQSEKLILLTGTLPLKHDAACTY